MAKQPKAPQGGRAAFLNASTSAAIAETIKKEDRTLHRLLQKQIELGRIVLPHEAGPCTGQEAKAAATEAGPSQEAVAARVAWLLQAHRGAGQAMRDTAAPVREQEELALQAASSGAADAGACKQDEAVAAARGEAEAGLQEQMRDISRSLWGTVSAGAASGAASYTSSSRSDYSWSEAAVEAMRRDGELDARHHRRRDAHAAYVEAAARDATLRRSAKPAGGGGGK